MNRHALSNLLDLLVLQRDGDLRCRHTNHPNIGGDPESRSCPEDASLGATSVRFLVRPDRSQLIVC